MTNLEAIVLAPLALYVLRRNVRRAERLIVDLQALGCAVIV